MRALATSNVLCHHGWEWVTVTRDNCAILQISGANCWARSLISGKEWEKLQVSHGIVSSRVVGWCFPTCSIIRVLGAQGCLWASQLSQALQAAWEQSGHKNWEKNPTHSFVIIRCQFSVQSSMLLFLRNMLLDKSWKTVWIAEPRLPCTVA